MSAASGSAGASANPSTTRLTLSPAAAGGGSSGASPVEGTSESSCSGLGEAIDCLGLASDPQPREWGTSRGFGGGAETGSGAVGSLCGFILLEPRSVISGARALESRLVRPFVLVHTCNRK